MNSSRHILLSEAPAGTVRFLSGIHVTLDEGKTQSWVTVTRTGTFNDPRHGQFVSILARPGGRALPTADSSFPSPSAVSILARPGGRALRRFFFRSVSRQTFQSSPAPEGGRYVIATVFLQCI